MSKKLINKALEYRPNIKSKNRVSINEDVIELMKAYFDGELISSQVGYAIKGDPKNAAHTIYITSVEILKRANRNGAIDWKKIQ